MRKIATLFDRDWEGNRGVVPRLSAQAAEILTGPTDALYPTEKLDGTNVRLTVRRGQVVRIEKRRNPSKQQKAIGITEPWYVDASPDDPADRAICEAAVNICWAAPAHSDLFDGEWSGEAVGPKIQGNPLALEEHRVYLFELPGSVPELTRGDEALDLRRLRRAGGDRTVPDLYEDLRQFLAQQSSLVNPERPIEGIVWQNAYGDHLKIKAKDFRT
jgi:hypothetical protein